MSDICDWYYDSDGDYVPASPDAWFDVFNDAEAAARYWGGGLLEESEAIGTAPSVLDGDDS